MRILYVLWVLVITNVVILLLQNIALWVASAKAQELINAIVLVGLAAINVIALVILVLEIRRLSSTKDKEA